MRESKNLTVEKAVRWALEEAAALGWADLDERAEDRLVELLHSLLKWNRTFNLTSISTPAKAAELHLLDSLALVPKLPPEASVLDVGAGAGFPGLVAAIARPDTSWTLVDRTEKKVAFMKTVIARMRLENAKALHRRLEGSAAREGIPRAEVVVSRAFMPPETWLPFAAPYVRPGGVVIAMLGGQGASLARLAEELGLDAGSLAEQRYRLPSGADRGLLFWRKEA